ncbi:hypothetical protein BDD12DRAFT_853138 [Trichophaea hybrida]|nr:hypothetical protein BDD12DRAFT_853138 [Trichophaea hybrida]
MVYFQVAGQLGSICTCTRQGSNAGTATNGSSLFSSFSSLSPFLISSLFTSVQTHFTTVALYFSFHFLTLSVELSIVNTGVGVAQSLIYTIPIYFNP